MKPFVYKQSINYNHSGHGMYVNGIPANYGLTHGLPMAYKYTKGKLANIFSAM